jgi:hypothetical protein
MNELTRSAGAVGTRNTPSAICTAFISAACTTPAGRKRHLQAVDPSTVRFAAGTSPGA